MNAKLLFVIITIITFTTCKTETKKEESIEIKKVKMVEETEEIEKIEDIEEVEKVNEVEESKKTEKAFSEFKILYKELIAFKSNRDFIKYGFGQGGPYYKWLEKVRAFKLHPNSKLLLKKGVLISELELLGMNYVGSNGKETEVTKTFNKIFKDAISK